MSNNTLIDNEEFELALTTFEDGNIYDYYINQNESDENGSVILYKNNFILCRNYHAFNSLMTTLEDIYKGYIFETDYTMSDTMKYNYNEMIKNNYFD